MSATETFTKKTIQASELHTLPRQGDSVSFFYILGFYHKEEIKGQPIATTKAPVRQTFGTGALQTLFERALAQVQLGERAEFKLYPTDKDFESVVAWNGFSKEIKNKADLEKNPQDYFIKLEVEISDIRTQPQAEVVNIFEMSTEAKKAEAEATKKKADEAFKAGKIQEAADLYSTAFKIVYFEDGEVFNDLKFKIGSNLAFMNLKLKKYEDCINMNDQFVRFGYEVTDKTFFRNAQAAELYGRLEEAIKYYEKSSEYSKDEEYKQSMTAAIVSVKKKMADKNGQVRKNMQKMWGS